MSQCLDPMINHNIVQFHQFAWGKKKNIQRERERKMEHFYEHDPIYPHGIYCSTAMKAFSTTLTIN